MRSRSLLMRRSREPRKALGLLAVLSMLMVGLAGCTSPAPVEGSGTGDGSGGTAGAGTPGVVDGGEPIEITPGGGDDVTQPDAPSTACPDRPDPARGKPKVDLKPTPAGGPDGDGDGIADAREAEYGTDACDADSDDDGLTDLEELWWATDPLRGDSDRDGKLDGAEVADRTFMWLEEDLRRTDQDADGLPDSAEEHVFGTDPQLFSTDGDSYPDGVEIFKTMHAAYAAAIRTKNPRAITDYPAGLSGSPFVADVVDIVVEVSDPGLVLKKDIRTERQTLVGSEAKHALRQEFGVTEKKTQSEVLTLEEKAGVSASMGIGLTGPTAETKVEASVTATVEEKWSTETEQASTFTVGAEFAGITQEEWRTVEATDLSEAEFWSALRIRNVGNDLLPKEGITDIAVNFFVGDDLDPWTTWTLSKSDCGSTSAYGNLPAGGIVTLGNVCFKVNSDVLKRVFAGEPVRAVVDHVNYGDTQVSTLDAQARALQIDVDFGDDFRRHSIAVPETGISLPEAYRRTGGTIGTEEVSGTLVVASVDGRTYSWDPATANSTLWTVYASLRNAKSRASVALPDGHGPVGLAGTRFFPGDQVSMRYEVHSDGDGLSDRQEVLIGTSSSNNDTDGDNLTDFQEVVGYGTNPLVRDTNDNGATDGEDVEAGRDPTSAPVARDEILSVHSEAGRWTCRVIRAAGPEEISDRSCPVWTGDADNRVANSARRMTAGQYIPGKMGFGYVATVSTSEDNFESETKRCYLHTLGPQGERLRDEPCGDPFAVGGHHLGVVASGRFLERDRDALVVAKPGGWNGSGCWLVPHEGEVRGFGCDFVTPGDDVVQPQVFAVDLDGDGLDEVGIARPMEGDGRCDFYDPRDRRFMTTFPCAFPADGLVAAGNLLGGPADEIVTAQNGGTCSVYDAAGARVAVIDQCTRSYSLIQIGDVLPGSKEELVVGHTTGTCVFWEVRDDGAVHRAGELADCREPDWFSTIVVADLA